MHPDRRLHAGGNLTLIFSTPIHMASVLARISAGQWFKDSYGVSYQRLQASGNVANAWLIFSPSVYQTITHTLSARLPFLADQSYC